MTKYKNIEVNNLDKISFISVNRPNERNALDDLTLNELKQELDNIQWNEEVSCVVITGTGEKAFAAGADISSLKERSSQYYFKSGTTQEFFDYVESYEKPTIAMINGYALGGGLELAMACDIRIVAEHAKLGLPELNLAIIPGAGGTQRLSRLVGKGRALEMILTGRTISSEEAVDIGLASKSVPLNKLKSETIKVAEQIVNKGPLAVKLAKIVVNTGYEVDIKTGLTIEKIAQAYLFNTNDKEEGTSAFLEKKKPKYKGN